MSQSAPIIKADATSAVGPSSHTTASLVTSYAVHGLVLATFYWAGGSYLEKPLITVQRGTTSIQLEASVSADPTPLTQQTFKKVEPPQIGLADEQQINIPRMIETEIGELPAVERLLEIEIVKPIRKGKRSESVEPPKETPPEQTPSEKPPAKVTEPQPPAPSPAPKAETSPKSETEQGADVDNFPEPLRTNSAPVYPASAVAAGHEGRVILLVRVGADGKVKDVQLRKTSGHKTLDDVAIETVSQWDFRPAHRHGVAVDFSVAVPFRFMLK